MSCRLEEHILRNVFFIYAPHFQIDSNAPKLMKAGDLILIAKKKVNVNQNYNCMHLLNFWYGMSTPPPLKMTRENLRHNLTTNSFTMLSLN